MAAFPQPEFKISKSQARHLLLCHQLLQPPRQLKGKKGILEFIQKVGCIQFDPLNIVGRNPDLVLQSRIQNYQSQMLYESLYQERQLLDGFDKLMSIYAIQDWPYFKRQRQHLKKNSKARQEIETVIPRIREAIRSRGPLSSLDLKIEGKVDWHWSQARLSRAALESLYFWGELIIHHKVNTRRIFDLAENHIPPHILSQPDPNPTLDDYRDWHILRRIGSIGLVDNRSADYWLGIHKTKSPERQAAMLRLIEQEKLIPITIHEIADRTFFIRQIDRHLLEEQPLQKEKQKQAALIGPLDNLIWNRNLIRLLFDFDYTWEVYKPAKIRKYGYYVLPLLYGDHFIGRVEPKLDQKNKALLIEQWWWEKDFYPDDTLQSALIDCFYYFTRYLNVKTIKISQNCRENLNWLEKVNDKIK